MNNCITKFPLKKSFGAQFNLFLLHKQQRWGGGLGEWGRKKHVLLDLGVQLNGRV